MTVLVTGGAGYIGSHMVLRLLDAGEDVVVLDNLSTGRRGLLAPEARFVEGSVGDERLLQTLLLGVEAVIHFAGSIVVPESVADPLSYYANNTVNSRTLIAASIKAGVKHFIFSSTAAVYGVNAREPVAEETTLDPISPYGRSKLMTEWMLEDARNAYGFASIALRYFNVAGADPKGRSGQATPKATHLIKVCCEVATGKRDKLEIFGTDYPTVDGTCVRDYIHVTDLVEAHMAALSYLRAGQKGGAFNCGYGRGYSVLQVAAAMEKILGRPLPASKGPRRAGDPPEIVANANRARAMLGWTPRHDDLGFIVRTALDWERALQKKNWT